jgi:hypothetical protein
MVMRIDFSPRLPSDVAMCLACVSNVDFIAANASIVSSVASNGGRKLLESMGVPLGRSQAERDARVVAFLRNLELDPAEILGPQTVADADAAAALEAARPRVSRRTAARQFLRVATI